MDKYVEVANGVSELCLLLHSFGKHPETKGLKKLISNALEDWIALTKSLDNEVDIQVFCGSVREFLKNPAEDLPKKLTDQALKIKNAVRDL